MIREWVVVSTLLLTSTVPTAVAAQPGTQPPAPRAAAPDNTAIARALARVKADPNLATSRTIKTLRWKRSAAATTSGTPAWLAWLAGLFRWFDQGARLFVWCAAVVLAGMLGAYIYRIVRARVARPRDSEFVAPTHVRDLDIRPESLPDDIGGAARALWDRGHHRAALALLYRGLLSRLAHAHRVPIRDSSTEGDCLALAAAHLDAARHEYVSRLVRVWQRTVYGHASADTTVVHELCEGFAPALDAAASEGRA
jgi:Domain of unknown function (DUF4129)